MKRESLLTLSDDNKLKIGKILEYNPEINDREKEFLINFDEYIHNINNLSNSIPDGYKWHFSSKETFEEHVNKWRVEKPKIIDINTVYWYDTFSSLQAYMIMCVWRLIDIAQSSLFLLDKNNIVPSAILARSAFETTIQFSSDVRVMAPSILSLSERDFHNEVCINEELESLILKTVFSSRASDTDEIYKPVNILTIIKKMTKFFHEDPIPDIYEKLCEITHPNFLGRSIYIRNSEKKDMPGSEIRFMSYNDGYCSGNFLYTVLWSLSWSIKNMNEFARILHESITKTLDKF